MPAEIADISRSSSRYAPSPERRSQQAPGGSAKIVGDSSRGSLHGGPVIARGMWGIRRSPVRREWSPLMCGASRALKIDAYVGLQVIIILWGTGIGGVNIEAAPA